MWKCNAGSTRSSEAIIKSGRKQTNARYGWRLFRLGIPIDVCILPGAVFGWMLQNRTLRHVAKLLYQLRRSHSARNVYRNCTAQSKCLGTRSLDNLLPSPTPRLSTMAPLLDSPNELLLQIAEFLSARDLGSFLQTNRRLASLLSDQFYKLAAQDKDNLQAIHWAAIHGKIGLIEVLLKNGADITAKGTDMFQWEALHYAVYSGNIDIVSLLLDRGADISVPDGEGNTPLHWAASQRRPAILKLLLSRGAAPDAQDSRGSTPLHMAVLYGSPGCDELMWDMIEALLEAGASPSIPDSHGYTPLHRLVQSDEEDVRAVQLVLGRGADISARDHNGMTPLHWVAKGGHRWNGQKGSEVAKLLIELGANPNTADDNGKTAFHYAAEAELKGVLRLLREKGTVPGAVSGAGAAGAATYPPFSDSAESTHKAIQSILMGRFVSNLQSLQSLQNFSR